MDAANRKIKEGFTMLRMELDGKKGLWQNFMAWLDWNKVGIQEPELPTLYEVLYGAARYMIRMMRIEIQEVFSCPIRVVVDRSDQT